MKVIISHGPCENDTWQIFSYEDVRYVKMYDKQIMMVFKRPSRFWDEYPSNNGILFTDFDEELDDIQFAEEE